MFRDQAMIALHGFCFKNNVCAFCIKLWVFKDDLFKIDRKPNWGAVNSTKDITSRRNKTVQLL
jgi:hypothetical protein